MKIEFSSTCKPACASTFFTLNFGCLARKLIDWHGRARVPDPVSWKNFLFCDYSFCTERVYSRGQHLCKFTKKSKRLQNKRVQLSQDLFGTPTTPPFHCFGSPIWPPRRHLKALYKRRVHNSSDWLAKWGLSSIEMTRRVWGNPSKHGKHVEPSLHLLLR